MSEKKKTNTQNRKIIPLQFDQNEQMDKELDALLKEDLMREADEIEAQLNSDPELIGMGASDDLFLKIVGELKEKGIWEEEEPESEISGSEMTEQGNVSEKTEPEVSRNMEGPDLEALYAMMPEEDRRALETGRRVEQEQEIQRQKKEHRKKIMSRVVRRGGTAAAVLALVFGVSMTSEANRRLVSQVWDAVISNFGLRMTTNYVDEENFVRSRDKEEISDFRKVSEELGIAEMDLGYLPEGMEYLNCEMDKETGFATMFYSYQEKIFRITMIKKDDEGVFYYALDNPSELESIFTDSQEIEVKMGVANKENETEAYLAQLEYNGCSFYLNGIISLDEMEKIVKNIYFL